MSDPTNEPSRKPICKPIKRMDLDAELPNNLSPKPKKPQEVDSKPKQDAELSIKTAST
jgi:hypothetical protein